MLLWSYAALWFGDQFLHFASSRHAGQRQNLNITVTSRLLKMQALDVSKMNASFQTSIIVWKGGNHNLKYVIKRRNAAHLS